MSNDLQMCTHFFSLFLPLQMVFNRTVSLREDAGKKNS